VASPLSLAAYNFTSDVQLMSLFYSYDH